MGDNVYLGDRDGVRTPMQWRPDRNAGFSQASSQRLYLPPIVDGSVPLRDRQRREPAPRPALAAVVDAAADQRALPARRAVARRHHLPRPRQPSRARVRPPLDGAAPSSWSPTCRPRAQSVELDLRSWDGHGADGGVRATRSSRSPSGPTTSRWARTASTGSSSILPVGVHRARRAGTRPDSTPGGRHGGGSTPDAAPGAVPVDPAPALVRGQVAGRSATCGSSAVVARSRRVQRRHPLRMCFVQVDYVDGEPDTYVVPLTVVDGERPTRLRRPVPSR